MPDTATHQIAAANDGAWHAVPDAIAGTGARTLTMTCGSVDARYAFGAAAPTTGAAAGHPFPCPLSADPVAWDLASGEKLWVLGSAGTRISIDRS